MRAASTGPIGALLVLAPLVLIPYIAMFGLPKFVSVELSQADDSEADLGTEWDSGDADAADSGDASSGRKSNQRSSLQEFFGASSGNNDDELSDDDFAPEEPPVSRPRGRSSSTGKPSKSVAAVSSRKRTGKTGPNAAPRPQPRNQRDTGGSRGGSRIQMPPEAMSGWEAEDEPGDRPRENDRRNDLEDDGTTIALLDESEERQPAAANNRRSRAENEIESRFDENEEPEFERTADASLADADTANGIDSGNTGSDAAPKLKKAGKSVVRSLDVEDNDLAADGNQLDLGEFKPGLLDEAYAAATGPRSKRTSGRKTATGTQLRGQSPELPRKPLRNGNSSKRAGRDEPLPTDEPLTFEKAQERLRDLGLSPGDYRVIRLKETGDFRFEANLRAGETARILRRFEADAADELSAVANVIEQIEQYLDSAGL